MKISTELRHIINSRFSTFAGQRIPENKEAKLVAQAAEKNPVIAKAIASRNTAVAILKRATKELNRYGITVYNDGELSVTNPNKFGKVVSLPPRPPTRNEVLHKLSALTPKEGVSYLKTLGIDWS